MTIARPVLWEAYGIPTPQAKQYPEIANWLRISSIGRQMMWAGGKVSWSSSPSILVEGKWTPLTEVMKRFSLVTQYGVKALQDGSGQYYCYLGNGRGLEPHNPFWDIEKPVFQLNPDEMELVVATAQKFAPKEGATCILQIVSGYIEPGSSNAAKFLLGAQHPYIRLISADGSVRQMGFGFDRSAPFLPLSSTQGRFSSPDPWEYKGVEERVVTNIPISEEELQKCLAFTQQYQQEDRAGFHILRQNCCWYVHNVCKLAGVSVESSISFREFLWRLLPNWLRNVCSLLSRILSGIPPCLGTKVQVLTEGLCAFVLSWIALVLGNGSGRGGVRIEVDPQERVLCAPLRSLSTWVDLGQYTLHHPTMVQEWQRKQASTVVYENPTRPCCIFPPMGSTIATSETR